MPAVEIASSWSRIGLVALSSVAMLAGIVAYVRIVGLRSFSKMASFDFAVTVAIGSLLGSVAMSGSSLADGLVAVGSLLVAQALVAWARRFQRVRRIVENQPVLLMVGSRLREDAMRAVRVSEGDVRAKLREANVLSLDQVRYVVLETTGDVSVLHGDGPVDPWLLDDVSGVDS